MRSGLIFLFVSVLLFSLISAFVPWVSATDRDAASLEVAEAEKALFLGYNLVLEAEEAGANVTTLLATLSAAGEFLAKADAHLRLGDYEEADRLAGFCVEVVDDVEREAVLLRGEAARLKREDFLVRVFGSAIGEVIVVVSGVLLWMVFKRRYQDRVLHSKPEVNEQ